MTSKDFPVKPTDDDWDGLGQAFEAVPASRNLSIWVGLRLLAIGLAIPAMLVVGRLLDPFRRVDVFQSRVPLSLAEARNISQLPFPDSAKSIWYASFSQFVAYEAIARFEAPVADCLAFADRVVAESDAEARGAERSKLDGLGDGSIAEPSLLKADWFDIQSMGRGVARGSGPHRGPKVWIDMQRGVCYYMRTD